MLTNYITIKKDGENEIEIKKSKFLCTLSRVSSEDEAKEKIDGVKKEHWKATHNCSAFVIGERSEIQRSSDDGEPSGTAGIPMLEVLKKKEIINTVAIVTRYFGGTKLGAGGLIRAYSQSVSEAIEKIGLVEGSLQQEVFITLDYPLHGKVVNFMETHNFSIKETYFTEKVTILCLINEKELASFKEDIVNLVSNQCDISLGNLSYYEKDIL